MLGICQIAALGIVCLLARHWYEIERARIKDELSGITRAFLTSPDSDTPSPLAVLADQGATLLAARFVQQIRVVMSGAAGNEGAARQLALIEEATASNPWLALIANILPKKFRNALMKNPQMIGALSKIGGGNHGSDVEVAPRRHRE